MAATFTVERTRTIPAPPEAVFALIQDFRLWTRWSPWEQIDPDLQRTYGGSDVGVGATYAWSGNKKAGVGHMAITDAAAPTRVRIALDFEKPFKSSNVTEFTLTPSGAGTHVRWAMTGPRPLFMRLFSFAFNMDKLVGRDFEKGLAQLEVAARG